MKIIPTFVIPFITSLGEIVGTILTTLLPLPHNIVIIILLAIIYRFSNILRMGTYSQPYCHRNKVKYRRKTSLWQSFKDAYKSYIILGLILNYVLLQQYYKKK